VAGGVGILHGSKSYVLQDADGQIRNAHSVSAGLDYPGVGPQHAEWADSGRVEYCAITDEESLQAFHDLARLEGILPALESAHALAETRKRASAMEKDGIIVVNLSGRGDKDVDSVLEIGKGKAP
jgi:tryptophan synthase beta chain